MKIIDTHAHIDQIEDLNRALKNAVGAGVESIIAVSMDVKACRRLLEIKKETEKPHIYLAMGIHPAMAKVKHLDECVQLIHENVNELVAVGEIGLDFWYKWVRKSDDRKNEQRTVYRKLLEVAKEIDLPPIIHSRGAWRECLEIVREVGNQRVLFHWYSGPIDVLKDILSDGHYVSTSPSVATSPQSQEAMTHAPIERTLIETDSPVTYRNRETDESFVAEPKDVIRTLKAYCKLKNLEEDVALEQLNQNAVEFFNLGSRG